MNSHYICVGWTCDCSLIIRGDLAASLNGHSKTASIFTSLTEQGNPDVRDKLAQGVGVNQDTSEYIKWCRQSAERGNSLVDNFMDRFIYVPQELK